MRFPAWLRILLSPLSLLYGAIARFRAWLYRNGFLQHRRLPGLVISVGNLTTGGTGKTPMVIWLAIRLAEQGRRVGVLLRGYRSAAGDPAGTSDEAQLLARRLPQGVLLGVGANRFARGKELASLGVDCFLLDDGFQHFQLARQVDVVLIDSTDPFGDGLLPGGRARESRSALRRADIIVITRSTHTPALASVLQHHTVARIFYAQTRLEGVFDRFDHSIEKELSRGVKYFAFCAVGNPTAFFDDLRRWSIPFTGQMAFRDHHRFTSADATELIRCAAASGADALLCTEKDTPNLAGVDFPDMPVCFCRISLEVLPPEEFWRAIDAAIARNSPRPS